MFNGSNNHPASIFRLAQNIAQTPLEKRRIPAPFNCVDFEHQSHVNWASKSAALGANVNDVGSWGGCARAPAGRLA